MRMRKNAASRRSIPNASVRHPPWKPIRKVFRRPSSQTTVCPHSYTADGKRMTIFFDITEFFGK